MAAANTVRADPIADRIASRLVKMSFAVLMS